MRYFLSTMLTLCLLVGLTGCNSDISPNDYSSDAAGVVAKVVPGEVLSKRVVNVKTDTGVGKVAGAVAGGIAGSAIGGGRGALLGVVGGAVLGGVLGEHVEDAVNTQKAYEYIVKLSTGDIITITQGLSTDLAVGQKVLLLYGVRSRLIADTDIPATQSSSAQHK